MRFKASEFASLIQYGALYNGNSIITGISTDSGDVKAGDMFVCIKGERTDGHKYVDLAVNNGASCVLSDRLLSVDIPYILVPDTVKALQDAARTYRKTLDVKIVAVTGSVGKTTTKELIASALSSLAVHKTSGNKNSDASFMTAYSHSETALRLSLTEFQSFVTERLHFPTDSKSSMKRV